MRIDKTYLCSKIFNHFETEARFAKAMGMSSESLYKKLGQKAPLTFDEIARMICLLDLKSEEAIHSFFI